MVRPALVLVVLAAALTARAGELPRRAGLFGPSSAPLAMLDSAVDVRVRGPIVEATVTQTFRNDRDRPTEATYVFPLPLDAAVSAMEIEVGARTIHAEIARRADAQRRYEDAVAAGLGAGLLDQERPDVFTQTISAIPAHGTVKVTLRYDTTAQYASGTWQLVLPLVVAPRYVPGTASGRPTTGTGRAPDTDRAPDASRVTPGGAPGAGGATAIRFAFSEPVDDVQSPSHELKRDGARYTLLDEHSDHDAIVRWRARVPAEGWVEQNDDGGYAAIVVEAPAASKASPVGSLLVVLDRAATTRGDADAVEHPFVRALLGALAGSDRVAISGSDHIEGKTPEQTQRALDDAWPKPAGAFDLTRVLEATHPGGAAVVLISDGLVADDRAAVAAAKKLGAPLHVIGVGPSPNRSLLTALATTTGGTIRFALPGDDLTALARDVLADAASPPAPLAVTWGTLGASEVVPATLPRVGAGQSALVLARVRVAQKANARAGGDVFAFSITTAPKPPLGATTARGALARRWARMKLDELVATGDATAIATHALRYGLVSPQTSMIAIGDEVVVEGGVKHTVSVPVSVPAGMRWQEVRRQTTADVRVHERTAEDDNEGRADKKSKLADKEREKKTTDTKAEVRVPAKPAEKTAKRDEKPAPKHAPKSPVSTQPGRTPIAAGPQTSPVPAPVRQAPPPPAEAPKAEPPVVAAKPPRNLEPVEDEDRPAATGSTLGGEADSTGQKRVAVEEPRTEAAPPAADIGEETLVTSSSISRLQRFSIGLGAGIAIEHGRGDFATQLAARYEGGYRTRLGVEGSLWFVDGDLEGGVLATVARHGIGHLLDLGAGLGVHFGTGIGPALDLVLRVPIPHQRFAPYLRYDGALLFHDGTRDGQNTTTIGVEASF